MVASTKPVVDGGLAHDPLMIGVVLPPTEHVRLWSPSKSTERTSSNVPPVAGPNLGFNFKSVKRNLGTEGGGGLVAIVNCEIGWK